MRVRCFKLDLPFWKHRLGCRGRACAALVKGKLIDSMTLSTRKKYKELLKWREGKGRE